MVMMNMINAEKYATTTIDEYFKGTEDVNQLKIKTDVIAA